MAEREFFNWDGPLLPRVAEWLIGRFESSDVADMQQLICVLPGRRAGRLLLGMLVQRAEATGRMLVPPRLLTPGDLPRALLRSDRPLATDIECTIAWTRALHALGQEETRSLLPHPPERNDALAWHELAVRMRQLHETLAGSMRDFAAVASELERDARLGGDPERWQSLVRVQTRYERELQSIGLSDAQLTWMRAIGEGALREDLRVVLIGVPELNSQQRTLLQRLDARVTALIHAPEGESRVFDDLGCVVVDGWRRRWIDIDESMLCVEDRPSDQAQRVLLELQWIGEAFSPHEVTIGLGDESLGRVLSRRGEWAGVGFHEAEGTSLRQTPPAMLLEAIAAWLADARFGTFAALLRHDDMAKYVERRVRSTGGDGVADWLSLLDKYFNDHLDGRFAGAWLGDPAIQHQLQAVHDAVLELARPLRGSGGAEAILGVLRAVYGDTSDENMTPMLRDALETMRDSLVQWHQACASMPMEIDAATAIRMFLSGLSNERVVEPARPEELEMLGWLELHLDPAPALVLTGCNEGSIPKSVMSDMFLPDGLRRAMGMPCDETRYARDVYLMTAIVRSRRECKVIAGRRSQDGDGLPPSRLLLACHDAALVGRVKRMCKDRGEHDEPIPLGLSAPAAATKFAVPSLPLDLPLPTRMRVTAFRSYLACPYRFALAYLLGLKSVRDDAQELDAMKFGDLAHEVLCAFGEEPSVRDSADSAEIEEFLLESLEVHSERRYGKALLPAVRLQLARLRQRLSVFAAVQAKHRQEGWRIAACEWKFDAGAALDIPDDSPMPVTGKIDRIDVHESRDETLIIDYKTGDGGDSPEKSHRTGRGGEKTWVDLQLPLYEHFARHCDQTPVKGAVRLGYIVLPKKVTDVKVAIASWTQADVDEAIELARQVVRDIRSRKFDLKKSPPRGLDEFARLCQTSVLKQEMMDAEGTDENEGGGQ